MTDDKKRPFWIGKLQPKKSSCCDMVIEEIDDDDPSRPPPESAEGKKTLRVELLAIDLNTCARCVPTGENLHAAVKLLRPAAEALGIELFEETAVVATAEEAKRRALKSSPSIRVNGRDIAPELRESLCGSCGDLVGAGNAVDCREWVYKGKAYSVAPLPLLVEVIMKAMLEIDTLTPIQPEALDRLPANLARFFVSKRSIGCC